MNSTVTLAAAIVARATGSASRTDADVLFSWGDPPVADMNQLSLRPNRSGSEAFRQRN